MPKDRILRRSFHVAITLVIVGLAAACGGGDGRYAWVTYVDASGAPERGLGDDGRIQVGRVFEDYNTDILILPEDASTQAVSIAVDDEGRVLVASVARLTGTGSAIVWLLDQNGDLDPNFDADGGWGFVGQEDPCPAGLGRTGPAYWSGPAAVWLDARGSGTSRFAVTWGLGCPTTSPTVRRTATAWFEATGLVRGPDNTDLPRRTEARASRIELIDVGVTTPSLSTLYHSDFDHDTYVTPPVSGSPLAWHRIPSAQRAFPDDPGANSDAFLAYPIAGAPVTEPDHVVVDKNMVALFNSRVLEVGENWTPGRFVPVSSVHGVDESGAPNFMDGARDPGSGDIFVATYNADAALIARFDTALDLIGSYGVNGIAAFTDPGAVVTRPQRIAAGDDGRVHIVGCSRVLDAGFTRIDPYMFYARLSPTGALEVLERVHPIQTDREFIETFDIAVAPGPSPRVVLGGKLHRPGSRGRLARDC